MTVAPAFLRAAPLRALPLRVVPTGSFSLRRSQRLIERNLTVYRHTWPVIVTGFFEPLFYLLSLGVGLGHLIGAIDGVRYQVYVAPALLAASAMNGAIYDSTMNVFWKLKFSKTYGTVLATPLGPGDVAVAEIMWALLRGLLYSVAFLTVMAALGYAGSAYALLALPACVLIGFAFAAVGMAATTWMRSQQDLELIALASLPLFLFSTTFYPLATYPGWLQMCVRCTPLYHGVSLVRGLDLGHLSVGLAGHAAYLLVMGLIGVAVSSRRISALLLA